MMQEWTQADGAVADIPVTGTPRLRVLALVPEDNDCQEFFVTKQNKPDVTVKKILCGLEIGVACISLEEHVLKVDAADTTCFYCPVRELGN